jgi:glycosidase
MRICGTTASLAGLEFGIENNDKGQVNDAINRIELLYGIAMSIGGIPLLYLGDELGALNDYSFQDCKSKKEDTRWVHRVKYDEEAYALSKKEGTIHSLLSNKIKHLMQLRTKYPSFGSENIEIVETGNQHILAFLKKTQSERVAVLANFSEDEYEVSTNNLPSLKSAKELLSNRKMIESDNISIPGYGLFWIKLVD